MSTALQHAWITGGRQADRAATARELAQSPLLVPALDAHRRRRGPYTAAGDLARTLVPAVLDCDPALARRYDIELLSAAPELAAVLPGSRETLTSMAIPAERTRYYARLRTRRIANGLIEFVTGALPAGPRTLIVTSAEHADRTDLEFLAAAVRRVDPARLRLLICSADAVLDDEVLLAELAAHAQPVTVLAGEVNEVPGATVPGEAGVDGAGVSEAPADWAWAHVQTECTSDDPRLTGAYDALTASQRAHLHDRRAADLAARDEQSLRTGPVPYHLEHGTDPLAGARALQAAQDYLVCMGFYEAAADCGYRGLALVGPATEPDLWWLLLVALGLELSVLSRTREALALYDQARLASVRPEVHMAAAYSTAMLYTRHNEPSERDEAAAKSWLNAAIATASLICDPSERAFQGAFYRNGLALVEVNLGDTATALRLVDGCIDSLDRLLAPGEHRLHRSVLKNNRARVYAALGRLDDALADYAIVIELDPNHAEHYLERGNILRRLGRTAEAAADYERAIALSPPFPEIYYNRGDLRLSEGDSGGALADFSYALELDPELTDAYVNRASIWLDEGDTAAALRDARAGLALEPGNAYLETVVGQVHSAAGDQAAAVAAYDRAITADPALQAAWGGRAAALFESGDPAGAIASLDRALDLGDDAALRFNRAVALEAAGRWADAAGDLRRAADLDPGDTDIAARLANYSANSH
jgi:tetratricopeptide (TPR) repeat protein